LFLCYDEAARAGVDQKPFGKKGRKEMAREGIGN
jgi:hypothetical protein